jgi:hypothetical protein
MPFSTDVRLPSDRQANFPRQCVVCGALDPDASIVLSSRGFWQAGGQLLNVLRCFSRKPVRVTAPACAECGRRLRRHRTVRRVGRAVGAIAVGAAGALLMMRLGHGEWRDWFGGEIVFVGAIVFALLVFLPIEFLFLIAFDIAVHSDATVYEFHSRDYAEEFAKLNQVAIED